MSKNPFSKTEIVLARACQLRNEQGKGRGRLIDWLILSSRVRVRRDRKTTFRRKLQSYPSSTEWRLNRQYQWYRINLCLLYREALFFSRREKQTNLTATVYVLTTIWAELTTSPRPRSTAACNLENDTHILRHIRRLFLTYPIFIWSGYLHRSWSSAPFKVKVKVKVKVSFVALFGIITVIHTNSTDRKRKITVEHSDKLGALLIQSRAGPQQITCHFRFTMINT